MIGPATAKRGPALCRDSILLPARKANATAEGGSKKGRFCRSLPTRFWHGRFDFQQIYRKGDLAIYRQTWNGNEHSAVFEVVRIKRRQGFEIDGRFVQPAEVYPASKLWGTDGFTLTDRDAAFGKLSELA